MRITVRPTAFEVGWTEHDGERQLVVVMVVGERRYVGTPTRHEARALRRHLGDLLNGAQPAVAGGPLPRRRWLPRHR